MKRLSQFKLPTLKELRSKLARYKTPIVSGTAVIAFILLFTVGRNADWTGVGNDETVETAVKTLPSGDVETTRTTKPQSGKTLWDILSLIGVPLSLAILGWWLQQLQVQQEKEQDEREKKTAESNQREEALEGFIDRISDLLIDKNIIALSCVVASKEGTASDEELLNSVKDVIQARTLSILRRLGDDIERKGAAIQFLADAEVIEKVGLDLSGTDLREINLEGANLKGIQLANAQLEGAKLFQADLSGANLSFANLNNASIDHANLNFAELRKASLSNASLRVTNLSSADLSFANLSKANLLKANLSNTILVSTDLRGAIGLDCSQLEGDSPPFLCNIALPKEIDIIPDRDCSEVSKVLQERYSKQYPKWFKTLEDAKATVERGRQITWD